jgi:flagellar motor protein MotB
MARRKEAAHGGHGWFVTFADLMDLLVSFFVMLVAFSTQDQAKLQVVAGSMRDAFGVQDRVRYSGIVEVNNGLPTRPRTPPRSIRLKLRQHPRRTSTTASAARARASSGRRISRSPAPRCGKRCRTCRTLPTSPSTS